MLRLILSRSHKDAVSGAEWSEFETLDVDIPMLEEKMLRGGNGESGYDITHFIGVEVLP